MKKIWGPEEKIASRLKNPPNLLKKGQRPGNVFKNVIAENDMKFSSPVGNLVSFHKPAFISLSIPEDHRIQVAGTDLSSFMP